MPSSTASSPAPAAACTPSATSTTPSPAPAAPSCSWRPHEPPPPPRRREPPGHRPRARRGRRSRAAPRPRRGPRARRPARDPPPRRQGVRRAARPTALQRDHLPQRRGLRRAGRRPRHPVPLPLRAPHASVPRLCARRLSPRRPHHRALQARPRRRDVRPPPPGAGAPHQPDRRLAGGKARAEGSRRGAGGGAPLHVAAGRAEGRHAHDDLRPARPRPGRFAHAPGIPRPHRPSNLNGRSRMATDQTFVIVGAALAGAKAAETLREEGFDGRVILLGAESERPYERPPLSKDYLRRETTDKPYVHDEGFYAANDIDLRTSTEVESIDPGASEVELGGGERIRYDRLLLPTGAEPRRLSVPGSYLDGILYLRSVDDSDAIAGRIDAGDKLVTIGAGWIGAEVAASARTRGCDVTVLEMASVPLERVLGRELGAIYGDIHTEHGVELLTDTALESFEGSGTVESVRTTDGRSIEADFVVVGVGVAPRTQLAEAAGLKLQNGILTNELLETSAPGILAAGDVANARHPLYGDHIRVEHWANALHQGPAAARNMLEMNTPYDNVPYFFSDQYDVGMEYAGYATEWDEVVFRGDVDAREFIAFWVADGRVIAGMNVNVWDVTDDIQALIRSKATVDRDRLADPAAPPAELATA